MVELKDLIALDFKLRHGVVGLVHVRPSGSEKRCASLNDPVSGFEPPIIVVFSQASLVWTTKGFTI
jgi:hypothetical protein